MQELEALRLTFIVLLGLGIVATLFHVNTLFSRAKVEAIQRAHLARELAEADRFSDDAEYYFQEQEEARIAARSDALDHTEAIAESMAAERDQAREAWLASAEYPPVLPIDRLECSDSDCWCHQM